MGSGGVWRGKQGKREKKKERRGSRRLARIRAQMDADFWFREYGQRMPEGVIGFDPADSYA